MSAAKIQKVKLTQFRAVRGTCGHGWGTDNETSAEGFIADMQGKVLKVGDLYQISFEIPVLKTMVTQTVKIMKPMIDRIFKRAQSTASPNAISKR